MIMDKMDSMGLVRGNIVEEGASVSSMKRLAKQSALAWTNAGPALYQSVDRMAGFMTITASFIVPLVCRRRRSTLCTVKTASSKVGGDSSHIFSSRDVIACCLREGS
ncbi:UNVERIFIED_CONTAM: hypothetical protein FKN15_074367 [Acipenser sinensis]